MYSIVLHKSHIFMYIHKYGFSYYIKFLLLFILFPKRSCYLIKKAYILSIKSGAENNTIVTNGIVTTLKILTKGGDSE